MIPPVRVRLANTASVARDHLANERTFLAWLRTSLTFSSAGVALTQLFRLVNQDQGTTSYSISTAVGALFVGVGIAVMLLGCSRYFHVQTVLQKGLFPVSRVMIVLVFAITLILVIITLVLLIVAASRDFR